MKETNSGHLQEEQVTWAVIDENELAGAERLHLAQCETCRGRVDILLQQLAGLGETARLSVPPSTKPVLLPREKPVPVRARDGWLSFVGAAAMAGLVLFFYFLGMEGSMVPLAGLQGPEDMPAEEQMMQEISDMVENPMAEELYEITGDTDIFFDDEFFEFLVPDDPEDFQSENILQGGTVRC